MIVWSLGVDERIGAIAPSKGWETKHKAQLRRNPVTHFFATTVIASASGGTNCNGCVTTQNLANGAVTNPKLATSSVSSANIGAGQVGTANIADSAVTTQKIASDAVTLASTITDVASNTEGLSFVACPSGLNCYQAAVSRRTKD